MSVHIVGGTGSYTTSTTNRYNTDFTYLMHPFVAHVALDPWFALDLVVFLFQQHVLFDRPVGNGVGVVRFQLVVATGAPESKIEKKR